MFSTPNRFGIALVFLHSAAVFFLLIPGLLMDTETGRLMFLTFRLIDYPVFSFVLFLLEELQPVWFWIIDSLIPNVNFVMICADVVLFLFVGGVFYFLVGFLGKFLIDRVPRKGRLFGLLAVTVMLIIGAASLWAFWGRWVVFRPVVLEGDNLMVESGPPDIALVTRMVQVLDYYGVPNGVDSNGRVLVPASVMRDLEMVWNYTIKANDPKWLKSHVSEEAWEGLASSFSLKPGDPTPTAVPGAF